jgi:hypothetical protein
VERTSVKKPECSIEKNLKVFYTKLMKKELERSDVISFMDVIFKLLEDPHLSTRPYYNQMIKVLTKVTQDKIVLQHIIMTNRLPLIIEALVSIKPPASISQLLLILSTVLIYLYKCEFFLDKLRYVLLCFCIFVLKIE